VESGTARRSQLERGDIHLAIMPYFETQDFQRRLLCPNYLLAVVPKTHLLSRRAVVDLMEVADEPLLLLKRGFGARTRFDAACNAAEVHPTVSAESGAPATLVALAEIGYGIAIIPSNVHTLRTGVCSALLAHRKVPIGWWSSIAWNPHRFLPSYAEEFVDGLVTRLWRTYPGRDLTRRAPPLPRPKE
jgi:DNA-binding transcriptional LysR family regulator